MYTVVHVQKTSSLYTNSHILLFIRGTRTVPYRTGLQVPVTRDAPCETTFFVFVCFFFFPQSNGVFFYTPDAFRCWNWTAYTGMYPPMQTIAKVAPPNTRCFALVCCWIGRKEIDGTVRGRGKESIKAKWDHAKTRRGHKQQHKSTPAHRYRPVLYSYCKVSRESGVKMYRSRRQLNTVRKWGSGGRGVGIAFASLTAPTSYMWGP